jgi:hypothetical protein
VTKDGPVESGEERTSRLSTKVEREESCEEWTNDASGGRKLDEEKKTGGKELTNEGRLDLMFPSYNFLTRISMDWHRRSRFVA